MRTKPSIISDVVYKSSQNRGEDHATSIIVKKHIFKAMLNAVPDQSLASILVEFELGPVSYDPEDVGPWLLVCRKILNLNQVQFGDLVDATQAEISNIEGHSLRASFSRERLTSITAKALNALKELKSKAA